MSGRIKINNYSIALRGYRPDQVDEYVARLQRVMSRVEADLRRAREQAARANNVPVQRWPRSVTDRPPAPGEAEDQFTDRMDSILRAAEEEAVEIRQAARNAAQAVHARARSEIAMLIAQRESVLTDLTAMRRQLENIVAAGTSVEVGNGPDTTTAAQPAAPRINGRPRL